MHYRSLNRSPKYAFLWMYSHSLHPAVSSSIVLPLLIHHVLCYINKSFPYGSKEYYPCPFPDCLSPTPHPVLLSLILHRLFGGKPSKQAPVTTAENMKNSTVISNPHATMNHVTTGQKSPDGGQGGGDGDISSPLFGGRVQGSGMGTLGSEQVRGNFQKQSHCSVFKDDSGTKSSGSLLALILHEPFKSL